MKQQDLKHWKSYSIIFIFLWLCANFFPGAYNVDTWNMYFEMESWQFTDWHSPFMGLLWKLLYALSDRFFSLYIFQMAWYFMLFHVFTNFLHKRWLVALALVFSVLLVFIPQYLMKDVLMALSWCSALLMLLIFCQRGGKIYLWATLLCTAYGLLLRPHALPAAWPLLLVCLDGFDIFKRRRVLKYVATVVLSCIIFACYYLTLWSLQAKPAYFTYKYRLADVLGISIMSGENFMPACVTSFPGYDQKKIEVLYTPATNDNIYFAGEPMVPPASPEVDACVKAAWIKAIKAHPFIYLKSRAIGYIYYLKIVNRVPASEYWNAMVYVIKNNYIPIDDHHTPFTQFLIGIWSWLGKTFFFDPWFWLLLNGILAWLFYKKYQREKLQRYKAQLALQLSCVLLQLSLFPFYQIDLDFRFSYLNMLAGLMGLLFYIDAYKSNKTMATVVD